MDLFATLKSLTREPAVPLVDFVIDDHARTDEPLRSGRLEAGRHYVRLRLARMFLKYQRTWFQEWFPAVQSHVRFDAGSLTIELPNVADAKRARLPVDGSAAPLIIRNVPLTPTVPFDGGLLELSASLMAIRGSNGVNEFIGVLGGFAEMLQVPQFTTTLALAKPLADGLSVLLKTASDHLHLGYFNSFGEGQLADSYIVVLRAPSAGTDRSQFHVRDGELCIMAGGQLVSFDACDYMLLRVEVFERRDDWEKLGFFAEAWQALEQVLADQGPDWESASTARLRTVLLRVSQAKELTKLDRLRINTELKARFVEMKQQYAASGLVGKPSLGFADIARDAPGVPLDQPEPSIDEWMAGT